MHIDDRNKKMTEIFERCLALSRRKGKDYAGAEDSLANLRLFGLKGIIIRLFDKLYRLKNIEESGKIEVKDESVKDTLMDTIIYAALAMIMIDDEKPHATLELVDPYTLPYDFDISFGNPSDYEVIYPSVWDEKIGK